MSTNTANNQISDSTQRTNAVLGTIGTGNYRRKLPGAPSASKEVKKRERVADARALQSLGIGYKAAANMLDIATKENQHIRQKYLNAYMWQAMKTMKQLQDPNTPQEHFDALRKKMADDMQRSHKAVENMENAKKKVDQAIKQNEKDAHARYMETCAKMQEWIGVSMPAPAALNNSASA